MVAVCVFCSAGEKLAPHYQEVAERTGRLLASHGLKLVYGGGGVGLMGVTARTAFRYGGQVLGIIPEKLTQSESALESIGELLVTDDLQQRKKEMIARSDVFVSLPGGYGTLDEVLEVITQKQLGYHQKPIFFINTAGFWDHLLAFFGKLREEGFIHGTGKPLFEVVPDPDALIAAIANGA